MDFRLYTFADLAPKTSQQIRSEFGGKALGLYEAHRLGLPIPTTWLIPTKDYQTFLESSTIDPQKWVRKNLGGFLSVLPDKLYAVRSSAQAEDSSSHSFAGIFESVLNVPLKDLPKAIAKVWESNAQDRSVSYQEGRPTSLMGVILQPMIEAKFAGVCFSKHPSPASLFENGQMVIEFAPTSGEAVVQGTVTPYRLSGHPDGLSQAAEMSWIDELLDAVLQLKKAYHREVDIEFVIDANEIFWLLQERPISKVIPSIRIDLSTYKRMYKRALLTLDIEFLIEGCALHLAPYLEINTHLERWMIMTTDEAGIQELWVNDLLNETVHMEVRHKIEHERNYLERLEMRYADHFHRLFHPIDDPTLPLKTRLFRWFEQMTPFGAHYYVPMFLIDVLYALLLKEFQKIDPKNGENELFEMTRAGIASLSDLLENELRKKPTLETCKKLAEQFGFLKCRQVFEEPYTAKELHDMAQKLPPKSPQPQTYPPDKYLTTAHTEKWFQSLRHWMKIRNQEMEYLIYAFLKARPLQLEASKHLGISLETFWRSSKELLLSAFEDPHKAKALHQFPTTHLTIVRTNGRTLVSPELTLLKSQEGLTDLKGRTVFGKGHCTGTVHIAYTPEELQTAPPENAILVTGMTTPDFVPHLRRGFTALVTDEGGILCHAAIVAREIPIPCIVGTGLATQRLKTGMTIRLDFDRGEIEIIS